MGFAFGWHYVGGSKDKQVNRAVVADNKGYGILLVGNWEVDTTDGSGGYQQGLAYAREANREMDAVGAPAAALIIYSLDSDRTADYARPYFQGIRDARGRPAGIYGGTEALALLDDGLVVVWGQANAGSWSGYRNSNFPTHDRAHFRQYLPASLDGHPYDPQDQLIELPVVDGWICGPGSVPPAPPALYKRRYPFAA